MPGLAQDDLAVSALFGTVVMIVITVAIAGIVLVWSESFAVPEGDSIDITFLVDEQTDSLQVVSVRPRADWVSDLDLLGSCTPTLNGQAFPTAAGRLVQPGDVLDCGAGEEIRIVNVFGRGDALVYRHTFE